MKFIVFGVKNKMFNEKQFNNLNTQLYYKDPKYYFDFASTTPVYKSVVDNVMEVMKNNFGNPSSLTETGITAQNVIKESTNKIKKILACANYELFYTSGATESNNWVANLISVGDTVITTGFEHPSVINSIISRKANIVYFSPNADGKFDIQALESLIETKKPKLVSIMGVNNETGLVLPIYEIARVCKNKTLLHCDITQLIPHCLINCDKCGCDFYTFSGHKFGAPKGIGALLVKQSKEKVLPSMIFGGHQQKSKRAGTENTPYISAMAVALAETVELTKKYNAVIEAYKNYFITNIKNNLINTKTNCIIINDKENEDVLFLPNIINICFQNINGYTLMKMLDLQGITVSTGSSCSADTDYTSPALEVLQIPEDYIHGSIRVSLGFGVTKNAIDFLIEKIIQIIKQLENME